MSDEDSAGSHASDADASGETTETTPATDASTTWASTSGGLEPVQEGEGGGWPPSSGQLEEFGKALRNNE